MTLLDVAFLGTCFALQLMIAWAILAPRFRKPWTGYNTFAVKKLIRSFCAGPEIEIVFGPIVHPKQSLLRPIQGMYESGESGSKIHINTQYVRTRSDLVHTLLHEICHYNQYVQGRFRYGTKGMYCRKPIEREARAFDRAWYKVALRMYRSFEKRRKV